MKPRNIIVIGASAGGFDALKKLSAGLHEDLAASIDERRKVWGLEWKEIRKMKNAH